MSDFLDDDIKSSFLMTLPQYHFERDDFVAAFHKVFTSEQIMDIEDKCTCCEHTSYFWFLRYDDEFYLVHMDSGTVINWYKHLGRTNTCNKEGFALEDLEEFLQLVGRDLGWDDMGQEAGDAKRTEWKRTSDSLPEICESVLFITRKRQVYKGFLNMKNTWAIKNTESFTAYIIKVDDNVVAWAHLPDTDSEDWITDRKPEPGSTVLIRDVLDNEVKIAHVTPSAWVIKNVENDRMTFHANQKSAWMPMPEIPENILSNIRCGSCQNWVNLPDDEKHGRCSFAGSPEFGCITSENYECTVK